MTNGYSKKTKVIHGIIYIVVDCTIKEWASSVRAIGIEDIQWDK